MKPLTKIAGINLAVMFAYSAIIRWQSMGEGNNASLSIMIFSAFAVGLHVLICAVVSGSLYGEKNKALRKAWLLSMGIVLLIGFSTCLGNASL
jgi:hypothetical protein